MVQISARRHVKRLEELQAQLDRPGPEDEPEDEMQMLKYQGNLELYTTENLKQREAIRTRQAFVAVLLDFWDVIDMIKNQDGTLNKETYLEMHFKLHKALIRDIDEDEARACAQTDWERDIKGCSALSFELFSRSLFELVDIWVDKIDTVAYVQFLRRLRDHITNAIEGSALTWKPDADICVMPGLGQADARWKNPKAFRVGDIVQVVGGREDGMIGTVVSEKNADGMCKVEFQDGRVSLVKARDLMPAEDYAFAVGDAVTVVHGTDNGKKGTVLSHRDAKGRLQVQFDDGVRYVRAVDLQPLKVRRTPYRGGVGGWPGGGGGILMMGDGVRIVRGAFQGQVREETCLCVCVSVCLCVCVRACYLPFVFVTKVGSILSPISTEGEYEVSAAKVFRSHTTY